MTPIEKMLLRLSKVRQRQQGQYSALCPAHDDTGPSLSVRENTDGAVLIYCHAGCTASEIVAAIGLEVHDLYPPRDVPHGAPKRTPPLLTAPQALALLADECVLVGLVAGNLGHGSAITDADRERVLQSAGTINWIRQQCKRGVYA